MENIHDLYDFKMHFTSNMIKKNRTQSNKTLTNRFNKFSILHIIYAFSSNEHLFIHILSLNYHLNKFV